MCMHACGSKCWHCKTGTAYDHAKARDEDHYIYDVQIYGAL